MKDILNKLIAFIKHINTPKINDNYESVGECGIAYKSVPKHKCKSFNEWVDKHL